jgi:hypothetical protein
MIMRDSHRRATLLVTAVDELFGTHSYFAARDSTVAVAWP